MHYLERQAYVALVPKGLMLGVRKDIILMIYCPECLRDYVHRI